MARVEPDDVKDIFDQKSVNSAMFVRAQGELPGVFVIFLPARNPEAILRNAIFPEIDGMEPSRTVGFVPRQRLELFIGKNLDPIEEFPEVVGISVSTVKFLVLGLVEFEGESDQAIEEP